MSSGGEEFGGLGEGRKKIEDVGGKRLKVGRLEGGGRESARVLGKG